MYLKNMQEIEIRESVAEIKRLAAMKETKLPDEIKEQIRLWVHMFDSQAERILDALDNRKKQKTYFDEV